MSSLKNLRKKELIKKQEKEKNVKNKMHVKHAVCSEKYLN